MNVRTIDIVLKLIVLTFLLIGLIFGISTVFEVPLREYFVTLAAAFCSGYCTLIGVLLTIKHKEKEIKTNLKEAKTPEIMVDPLYNITKSLQVHLYEENCKSTFIRNNNIKLKNTDKVSFQIKYLYVNSETVPFKPSSAVFIEKNQPFNLSFYYMDEVRQVNLFLLDLDSNLHEYEIKFIGGELNKIRRKN